MKVLFVVLALATAALSAPAAAALFSFRAFMDGPSESPPVTSPGTGVATLVFDDVAHTYDIDVEWQGLIGTTTIAHIHAPTAVAFTGTVSPATVVPTFPGFPVGVTSGTFSTVLNSLLDSTYSSGFITTFGGGAAAESAFVDALEDGKAYFNIHTNFVGSGEIRGFFVAVSEPATWAMLILGLAGVGAARRRLRPTS